MYESPQPCIFVVGDEAVIVSTLVAILNGSGFHTTGLTNPKAALEAANAALPDVLSSNVMMPEMSGIDRAIRLTALCPPCRVLPFSGQAITADLLLNARDKGHAFTLLMKPIHPSELLAVLGESLGFPDRSMRLVQLHGIGQAEILQGMPFN